MQVVNGILLKVSWKQCKLQATSLAGTVAKTALTAY